MEERHVLLDHKNCEMCCWTIKIVCREVGETLSSIIGKAIGWAPKSKNQEVAGSIRVASGLESDAEAGIHVMR